MGLRRPQLSIGAKLTLRYTLAMGVTIGVFALIVYQQVERRINREAALLLEVQVYDLVDAFQSQLAEHPPEHVMAWMEQRIQQAVRHAEPDLDLGIQLLDRDGAVLLEGGSLAGSDLPLPRDLVDGRRSASLRSVNLGKRYAYLTMAAPVGMGFVRMAIHTRRYADNVRHIRRVIALWLPIALLSTALAGVVLARRSLRPIARINRAARRISGANLDENIPTSGSGDELDQLAGTLNEMMGRIRDSVARAHRFNANAAHELRTPLTALRNEVEVTLEEPRHSDEYRRVLEEILVQIDRLGGGLDAMLQLSRSEEGLGPADLAEVDTGPLLRTAVDFFTPAATERGIELRARVADGATVLGNPSWLLQAVSNLVSNAIKYTPSGGRIEVGAEARDGWLRVRVSDTGPGIAPEALDRVFERFERAGVDRSEPGLGLGLAIAQEIARAHGGRIEVESSLGHGSTFTLWLPLRGAGEVVAGGAGAS